MTKQKIAQKIANELERLSVAFNAAENDATAAVECLQDNADDYAWMLYDLKSTLETLRRAVLDAQHVVDRLPESFDD
ncbi:hypothetical protein IJ103_00015 [Candidatus Saccharibacteria bacterium]|nr:hypothetical protein [Candidatus Saccharibacteria bacterium]